MKRNPIDWSGGSVVDTSALDLTKQQKYDIGVDNEIEKRWEDFNEWLYTCPFKWSRSSHPTSGMTAINFDIEEE